MLNLWKGIREMNQRMSKKDLIHNYLSYVTGLNYKEQPPSMEEFLSSPQYLGKLTNNGKSVYPVWKDTLELVAKEDSKYVYVLTGAIGIGKTFCAIYGMLYTMCRVLCLKDPWAYFGKAPGSQMSIVFFNLTKSQSESTAYKLFQNCLVNSPWFRERGFLGGSELNPKLEFPLFKYTFASPFVPGWGSQGEHIILALLDEVDSPIASEIQREKVVSAYENARRRLESRFVTHEETIGRFFMVASKQERLSFLNTFIAKYKNSKSIVIVDVPLWLARPRADFSKEEFTVSCGDVYNPPKIVETPEELEQVTRAGYQIIRVPMDFYDLFLRDVNGSLRDIGGISVSHIRATKLFPSESLILKCFTEEPNPVKVMTLNVGLKDDINLLNFLDLNLIKIPRNVPRFIHGDFAYSGDGDAFGLAMSCISGWARKNVENADGTFHVEKVPVAATDFALRIKAYPGDRIPLALVRKMILDLKSVHGFNIAECTFDLRLATESDKQILERAGIACDYFSVDKDPNIYRGFRNLILEERWSSPWHPYLHFELKNLEEDSDKNMIDHPEEVAELEFLEDGNTREIVLKGSKDISDSVAASVTRAIEKCIMPPDQEIMKNLLNRTMSKPKDVVNSEYLRLAGVEVKREEKIETGVSKEQLSSYNMLLRKAKCLQKGQHGIGQDF